MAEEITFEQGFAELTEILESLEQALRGFLEDRKGELERIEAGDELPEIRISANSAPRAEATANGQAPAEPTEDELPF